VNTSVMQTYGRYNVTFEKGEGAYLFDTAGRRYLDFGSGIAVNSVGHCHPHLVEALKRQAEIFWHCSNLYNIPDQQRLADRLTANCFAGAVFFNNSGNEAVEMMAKIARKYQFENGHPERYRVISIEGAFHGRSLAMLAAGKQEKHLNGFGPVVSGFDQVAFGNLNEMRAAIMPETAAIIFEPVQGEGGIRVMDVDYVKALRDLADEFGLLLMADEVQTGVGRTGKLFAHEWLGIKPDVMALAKGLGGGFPVGATLATTKVAAVMTPGTHGSTFGGNPLAMAVANAVLDVVLADGFMENVMKTGKSLYDAMSALTVKYPNLFTEARGIGMHLGLKCKDGVVNNEVVVKAMENGLLVVPAGDNVIRMIPPMTITEVHVNEAKLIMEKTCDQLIKEGVGE
jgi:acetylornithine/N-succinyldiaminopimelate aminotransferase